MVRGFFLGTVNERSLFNAEAQGRKGSLRSYESRRDGIFVIRVCENRLAVS